MPTKDLQTTDCVGCSLFKKLEERVRECEERLNAIDVAYAKIETKLNLIIAILGCIGAAVAGVLITSIL